MSVYPWGRVSTDHRTTRAMYHWLFVLPAEIAQGHWKLNGLHFSTKRLMIVQCVCYFLFIIIIYCWWLLSMICSIMFLHLRKVVQAHHAAEPADEALHQKHSALIRLRRWILKNHQFLGRQIKTCTSCVGGGVVTDSQWIQTRSESKTPSVLIASHLSLESNIGELSWFVSQCFLGQPTKFFTGYATCQTYHPPSGCWQRQVGLEKDYDYAFDLQSKELKRFLVEEEKCTGDGDGGHCDRQYTYILMNVWLHLKSTQKRNMLIKC